MNLKLTGRRVLCTGASKGIGLACAESFAAEGANIVLSARDPDRLEAAVSALRGTYQTEITSISADLSQASERKRLVDKAGEIDILVNSAGAIPGGSLFDLSMERWEEAWSLKVMGYMHMTQLVLAPMSERGSGVIVNIIGLAGRQPRWSYICGATGNAALIAFTEAVGGKSVDFGVRVFGINPTATKTDRIMSVSRQWAASKFGDEERWEEAMGRLPFDRLCEPAEIADIAVMLASPKGGYVSGTVVDVDGGVSHY
jgi:3-oxoacyl-[acyl-carrier protein] reductase